MGRAIGIVGIFAILAGLAWINLSKTHQIVVSDAVISLTTDGTFMVGATIANAGEPEVLVSAQANGFSNMHFMGGSGPLVIPGGSAPTLAGDGAHIMMSGDAPAQGQLVPLILTFKNAGRVSTQARVEGAMMDHSRMAGIDAPTILLDLKAVGTPGRTGLKGRVDVNGMRMIARSNDAAHAQGEGHAHVYLNGLKLQRLYGSDFETGTLLPGDYILTVSLNANDHRPYVVDGTPISESLTFTVE